MKKAFTLIELLVAMAMSSLIFVVVSALLLSVVTSNTKSKSQENFEQVKNDLALEISNEIRWGKTFACTNCHCDLTNSANASLTVNTPPLSSIYRLNNGAIEKNGSRITPTNVKITKFYVCDQSTVRSFQSGSWTSSNPSYEVVVDMETGTVHDTLSFIVSNRKQDITK